MRFAVQAYFHHREIMVTSLEELQGIFIDVKD